MDESVVREFEQQQVGKLSLSQAIRIGAKLRPQHYGLNDTNYYGRSCALGAAEEALTGIYPLAGVPSCYALRELFPPLVSSAMVTAIWRKNDYDRMTREQIADWLESIGY